MPFSYYKNDTSNRNCSMIKYLLKKLMSGLMHAVKFQRRLFAIASFFICFFASLLDVYAQNVGDYRTNQNNGNWNNLGHWQRWNGTAWVTPTMAEGYPGQFAPAATQVITIRNNFNLNVTPAEDIGSLVVDASRTLNLNTNHTLRLRGTLTIDGTCGSCNTRVFRLGTGNFRSVATGNWGTAGTWQRYDAATKTWAAATEHPGQNAVAYGKVFIRPGHTVTIDVTTSTSPIDTLIVQNTSTLTSSCSRVAVKSAATLQNYGTFTEPASKATMILQNGDYRSAATGNWTTLATWETYNGSSWAAATTYPGQNVSNTNQNVIIRNTHTVTVNAHTVTNTVKGIFVAVGATLNVSNPLEVPDNSIPVNCGTIGTPGNLQILDATSDGLIRSKMNGEWADAAIWQTYDAASGNWVSGGYPGESAPTSTSEVLVRHNVLVNTTPFDDLNKLTVAASGTLTFDPGHILRLREGPASILGTCPDCATRVFDLATGDYRTSASGNWQTAGNWQVFDAGTKTWSAATNYPGEVTDLDNRVFVRSVHGMSINASVPNIAGNVLIENFGSASITNCSLIQFKSLTSYGTFNAGPGRYAIIQAGDYRSAGTGDWGIAGTWQSYDGSNWVAATEYPGQNPLVGTRDVIIQSGHSVSVNANVPNNSGDVFIGSGGTVTVNSTFELKVNTLKNCGTLTVIPTGFITYDAIFYRTVKNGNWSDISVWEVSPSGMPGTFSPATDYPGQNVPAVGQTVTLLHTVNLDLTPMEDVRTLNTTGGSITVFSGNQIRYRTSCTGGSCASAAAQVNTGDYRTINITGNWLNVATWQQYDGTDWVSASNYPGQNIMVGTPNIFIRPTHAVDLDGTPTNEIGHLRLENLGTLNIMSCYNVKTLSFTNAGSYIPNSGRVFILAVGDFRSVGTGNWTNTAIWQRFDGTTWGATADYPAFNASTAGTKVFIKNGHTVTLDDTPLEEIGTLSIDPSGALIISGDYDLRYRGEFLNCGTYTPNNGVLVKVNIGDYRTTGTGNWNSVSTWEKFNGTAWVAATDFPGQTTPMSSGTVVIRKGHAITSPTTPEEINNLLIEITASLTISGGQSITAIGSVINYGTVTGQLTFGTAGDYRTKLFKDAIGDYRSNGSGNWDNPATWQRYNGTTWVAATDFPGQTPMSSGKVLIQNGHNITVTTSQSGIYNLEIATGGTLTINASQTLTVDNIFRNNGTLGGAGTLIGNTSYDWSDYRVWEKYTGTNWIDVLPGDYPAKNTSVNPPKVSILSGYTINADVTPFEDTQNVTIFAGGTLNFVGTNTLRSRTAPVINGTCTTCASAVVIPANGDYRSLTGNWSALATWQQFNGTTWVNATDYPGQIAPLSNTQRVFVRATTTVNLNLTPIEDIGRVFLENGGTLDIDNPTNTAGYSLRARSSMITNGTFVPGTGTYVVVATGDYRTAGSGNWGTDATWQEFDGTTWNSTSAGEYPGATSASSFNSRVFVRTGHTVTHNISPPEDIGSLFVEYSGKINMATCHNLKIRGTITLTPDGTDAIAGVSAEEGSQRLIKIKTGDYRSNTATGNWSAAASWQKFNGTTWIAAPESPGAIAPTIGQNIIIRSGHDITFNATPAQPIANIYVENGGTLTNGAATGIQVSGRNVTDPGQQCGTVTETDFVYLGSAIYYQSRNATGNWSNPSDWDIFSDPGFTMYVGIATDYPGERRPGSSSQIVRIKTGDVMNVNISPFEDIITLQVQGTLNFSGGHNLKVWGSSTGGGITNTGSITNTSNTDLPGAVTNTVGGGTITFISQGDYRSIGSGNWSDASNWQFFNASFQWINATTYPGQSAPVTPSEGQSVIIRTGHTITANVGMPTSPSGTVNIVDLIIEDGATLTPNAGSNISIRRDMINHGTFTANTGDITFVFNSSGAIKGSVASTNFIFNNFTFNKNGGTLSTRNNFRIRGNFANNSSGSSAFTATSPSTILFDGNKTQLMNSTVTNPLVNVTFYNMSLTNAATNVINSIPFIVSNELNITSNAKLTNNVVFSTVVPYSVATPRAVIILNTLSADAAVGSQFINSTNAGLVYRGTAVPFTAQPNKLVATATNNTVVYDLDADQIVYPGNYFNLTARSTVANTTKTINVNQQFYNVTGLLSVEGDGTIFNVNDESVAGQRFGRLLNQKVNIRTGARYFYNANDSTDTNGNGDISRYNGPGTPADLYLASNFSGKFNRMRASNHGSNEITSSNLNDIRFNRTGAGSVYTVRNVNIPDVANGAVVRFDIVGATNSATTNSAAKILIGNGFGDNEMIDGTVAARLDINFRGSSRLSITHQPSNTGVIGDFAPSTGSRRKTITWFINTSAGSLNYTPPNGGATVTLPANQVHVWDGTTRYTATTLATVTAGATMNALKIILDNGSGSFTLENIKVNPIAELLTGTYTQANLGSNPLCINLGSDFNITLNGGDAAPYSTNSPASFVYNPKNEFIFHLSAPDGSFTNFTEVGRKASTSLSGSVNLIIPATIQPTMATGSNFRIRVISTDPPMVAVRSLNDLAIRSYSIVKDVDSSLPVTQAITTTAPNQFTDVFRVNGTGISSYQWRVTKVGGGTYNIVGATAATFQADGTKFNSSMMASAGIHFPEGVGVYELFCEVNTTSCGIRETQRVRIILECAGCAKNSVASACPKNIVFNGDFEAGPASGSGFVGTTTGIFPASLPDPNNNDAEGIIPYDGNGGYGSPLGDMYFVTDPNAAGNAYNSRVQTYTAGYLAGGTAQLRFNTPYGFSTEYGYSNSSYTPPHVPDNVNASPNDYDRDMGREAELRASVCSGSMNPENTWAVTDNPRRYHSNFCNATGGAAPISCGTNNTGEWKAGVPGMGASLGTQGPPFISTPFEVVAGGSTPAGAAATYPNGNFSPSGNRFLTANASPFTANKVWSQRFKVRKNTDYVFSFWAVNLNNISSNYGVYANCSQIGNNIVLSGYNTRCAWRQYTFLWNSGELTTVELSIRNTSTVRSGNDLSIDDIMFYRCDGNTDFFPTANKFVWRGLNTDWFNADNWGNCTIPDCNSDVIIPATSTNVGIPYFFPIIQESSATSQPDTYGPGHPALANANPTNRNNNWANIAKVRTITIEYGAKVTIKNGWNLDVCGDFINAKNVAFPPTIREGLVAEEGATVTFTATGTNPYTAKIIGNFTNNGVGEDNSFASFVVRKKTPEQVVQLEDDIDVRNDLAIINGTLDANQKYILFSGDKFINGISKNSTTYLNGYTNNNYGSGSSNPIATDDDFATLGGGIPGASFEHGNGTVEFRKATVGDQSYYREQPVACPTCKEAFNTLLINQQDETRDVNLKLGDLIVENQLVLNMGHIFTDIATPAKEVFVSNSDVGAIVNHSDASYIITTLAGNNLTLRRSVNHTGTYDFPVGGESTAGDGDPSGPLNGYRLLTITLNQPLTTASSLRTYFASETPAGTPNLPGTVTDACAGSSFLYDLCTGGHWDLKTTNISGAEVTETGPNYNLILPAIDSGAFVCSNANITFMKQTDGASPWGFANSCYVSAGRRDNFNSFSKFGPVSTSEILPVEFLSFDAIRNNKVVDVRWETISERGASHFNIQRSTDGKNFTTIGKVIAKGNANTTQKYLFTDTKPNQGMNYYRLLQVDIDGSETLTNVVAILFEGDGGELIIYPNPSDENTGFNVIIPTQIGAEIELKMVDALGKEVYYQRTKFGGGVIQVPSNFAKGLYTLSVATPTDNFVRKVVIQ